MTTKPKLSATALARLLDLEAPDNASDETFDGVATLNAATPRQISLVASDKYLDAALASKAGLILIGKNLAEKFAAKSGAAAAPPVLVVPHIWSAVVEVLRYFYPEPKASGKRHASAIVDPEADIADNVDIGPLAIVEAGARIEGDVVIGAGCHIESGAAIGAGSRLFPRAIVMAGCLVGKNCRLGPGAIVGYDGFKTEVIDGGHVSIPQVGIAVLEDGVELGAGTCIDRASFDETRIGARTKIDNLTQVGHNCHIGSDCLICAQVGVAGSVTIGPGCMIGGQVGIADNLEIAGGTIIMAQSGIPSSLKRGVYFGSPAMPARQMQRVAVTLPHLPEIHKTLKKLAKSQEG